ADVGDPHADLGVSTMLMACTDLGSSGWWQRAAIGLGRGPLRSVYRRHYARQRPVEDAKLHYYQAWAAVRRAARFGRLLVAGPQVTGAKPELLNHVHARNVEALCRYFERLTGVALKLSVR